MRPWVAIEEAAVGSPQRSDRRDLGVIENDGCCGEVGALVLQEDAFGIATLSRATCQARTV